MQPAKGESKDGMVPWEPSRYLEQLGPEEVRYSRGFLRSKPERWFPGFAAHWMPLGHSLGVDFKVLDVRPLTTYPREFPIGFVGTVDNESIGLFLDETSAKNILEPITPGVLDPAREVVLEYLSRRLLSSLERCWSGPETSVVKFEPEGDPFSLSGVGAVRFQVQINGNPATVWLVLGRFMVDRLDGLWRRQIHSSSRQGDGNTEVHLEITQLAVPPSTLVEYVRSGTAVDLEVPAGDSIVLRSKGKGWLPAKLRAIGDRLGFEVQPGQAVTQSVPEGMTRLSICLGSISMDAAGLSEIAQAGAAVDTGLALSNRAVLLINNEKVGEASLCVYEGRFAISVA